MRDRPTGIDEFPDLAKRYDLKLSQLPADGCGGCKVRELVETFNDLVRSRQKRDSDFRKR